MTRFARYSTKGIKKPPCEATPWSEMAPPVEGKHAAAAAEEPTATPKGTGKRPKGKLSDEVLQHVTASTGKKKGKKNAVKRMSLPASTADFDGSDIVADEPSEVISPKMNGKKFKGGDKQVEGSVDQSAKKKKKRLSKGATRSDDVEHEEDGETAAAAAAALSDLSSEAKSPKKGMKRKDKDDNLPKNKKQKRPSTDNEVLDLPDVSEDLQTDDVPEETSESWKPTPKNLNGRGGTPNKNTDQGLQNQMKPTETPPPRRTVADDRNPPPVLAEGPLMTQFEGYWVRRRAVPRLEAIRTQLAAEFSDPQTLKREMKKRKRAEHRLLLSHLSSKGARPPTSAAARVQVEAEAADDDLGEDDDAMDADGDEGETAENAAARPEAPPRRKTVADVRNPSAFGGGEPKEERMVKFDGVWMTGDAVGRLKELRRTLKQQRVTDMVLKQTMKTARRREEMKRKRDAKRVCLGCRKPGHIVSDCPHRPAGTKTPVTGLCFRCGSTEHRLSECRRPDSGKLQYAVCFVCGKSGHLSRDCSLNPNGVYPKGGSCKVCQRRDHLADDCPEQREQQLAASAPRLATIGRGGLEDDYQHDFKEGPTAAAAAAPAVRQPKKIKF